MCRSDARRLAMSGGVFKRCGCRHPQTGRQVADMFHTLGSTNNRYGRPPTPATLHRIRATLRGALNAAIRDGLLRDNPTRCLARAPRLVTRSAATAYVRTDPVADSHPY